MVSSTISEEPKTVLILKEVQMKRCDLYGNLYERRKEKGVKDEEESKDDSGSEIRWVYKQE